MSHRRSRDPRDTAAVPRICAHPDCLEDGLYPAPKSRNNLREYYWFCKEHVREYNAAWDYCRGLGQAEIDRIVREDVTWGRPTWPLGLQQTAARARGEFKMYDTTGIFDEDEVGPDAPKTAAPEGSEPWAIRVLGLVPPLTLTAVKRRYKELAKQFHPDVNGGDPQAEERLKRINLAYSTLRSTLESRV